MGFLNIFLLTNLLLAGACCWGEEVPPRPTRTIARLFGLGGGSEPQQPPPQVPPGVVQPVVPPFPQHQQQHHQVVRKPLIYSVKYYDRTGDVNSDTVEQANGQQQQYERVQPSQRVFLNLYTGQTTPVYYDSKGQLLVPCPVYDHVYVNQQSQQDQKQQKSQMQVQVQSQQQQQQSQQQQQHHPVPVGVVKQVPVGYNVPVPQVVAQQSVQQQQHGQHHVSYNGPSTVVGPNVVPIPVPSQFVYDRYHQQVVHSGVVPQVQPHQQQQQQHQQQHPQVSSPFVSVQPDVVYFAVPTSTSGGGVMQHNGGGVGGGGGQVQVPVQQVQYGPPGGGVVYTGLPYDVPYQYVVTSPPGSYYPFVYVKQATPTVTVQQSHSSQSSSQHQQQPQQQQQHQVVVMDPEQQQKKQDEKVVE